MQELPSSVFNELKLASPWVTLIGIACAASAFVSLAVLVLLLVPGQPANSSPGLTQHLLTYCPLVLIYSIFGVIFLRFARSIRALQPQPTESQLLSVLKSHTQVWRAAGIALVAFLVFNLMLVII